MKGTVATILQVEHSRLRFSEEILTLGLEKLSTRLACNGKGTRNKRTVKNWLDGRFVVCLQQSSSNYL
jgi:hypothetical protein